MALYRNIAGLERTERGEINPYKLTRPIDDGGGGYTRVPISNTFLDSLDAGQVFYDPGVVPTEATVYAVQKDEPHTQVQQVLPVQSVDLPPQDQPLTPVQTVTTVDVVNEPTTKGLFPLLTLGLLYVTMIKGESLLGKNQGLAFVGGLGLLYYQFSKKAGTAAP
jgi:hypothetical protein